MRRLAAPLALALAALLAPAATARAQTHFATLVDSWQATATAAYAAGSGTITFGSATSTLPTLPTGGFFRVTVYRGTSPSWTKIGHYLATGSTTTTLTGVTAEAPFADNPLFVGDTIKIQVTAQTFADLHAAVNAVETGKAPLASPAFTGTPTAPTATAGTSTTQLATTAFVAAAVGAGGGSGASIGGAVGGSPTSGQVLYTDGSGNLAQSPGVAFDATNKTLTLTSAGVAQPGLVVGTAGQPAVLKIFGSDGTVNPQITAFPASNFTFIGGSRGSQWFWDGGSGAVSTYLVPVASSGVDVAALHKVSSANSATAGYVGYKYTVAEIAVGSGPKTHSQWVSPADAGATFSLDRFARPVSAGTAPGIAAGAGAGTSPTVTIAGNDVRGVVTIATGTSPSASATVATITFAHAYDAAPGSVELAPANAAAAALGAASPFADSAGLSASAFTINAGATPLGAGATYKFYYRING